MKLNPEFLQYDSVINLEKLFSQAGFILRFVGGCVRDTILSRKFSELDLATNATPEQMMNLLVSSGIRAIPTGISHGTITVLVDNHPFEITTLRRDLTTDGRHADVEFTTSWEEDAKRRDFTMNALYLDMEGVVYDYVGGLSDCKARYVRFIGDADSRIKEDYLRILRYFRFVASVGENKFDDEALIACTANKSGIEQLSGERIAQELLKLLACKKSSAAISKLLLLLPASLPFPKNLKLGQIKALDYDLSEDSEYNEDNKDSENALAKLALLIENSSQIKSVSSWLKLSRKQSKKLELWLANAPLISPQMSELEQKKMLRKLGAEDYIKTIQIACALFYENQENYQKNYQRLFAISSWKPPIFPIKAKDLIAKGYKPGKELGEKLKSLEKNWEDNNYVLAIF